MSYSLNEMEATAKRAARGAGYSWGLAEEAGKATRWLCAHGLEGEAALARLLEQGLANPADHAPQTLDGDWSGSGMLCPLTAGALVSDLAGRLQTGPIHMREVAVPIALLPFAASAARRLRSCVSVECDGLVAVTDGSDLSVPDGFPETAQHVTVRVGGSPASGCARKTRARPDPANWAVLNRFAHRTFAPATEESRLLGAGAGLSDND
ncbi:MAG: DUF3726 domain-containing protein [Ruegeria sp.]|uniref:DUF3726 domain-containing protein n=1 Tax=Ruegeria sp. TaxID=1879320 RepID=UPI00349EC36A